MCHLISSLPTTSLWEIWETSSTTVAAAVAVRRGGCFSHFRMLYLIVTSLLGILATLHDRRGAHGQEGLEGQRYFEGMSAPDLCTATTNHRLTGFACAFLAVITNRDSAATRDISQALTRHHRRLLLLAIRSHPRHRFRLGSRLQSSALPGAESAVVLECFGETVEKAHVGMTRATNCTGCAGRDDEARARREERSAQHEGSEHALTTPTAFHPLLLYHDTR